MYCSDVLRPEPLFERARLRLDLNALGAVRGLSGLVCFTELKTSWRVER